MATEKKVKVGVVTRKEEPGQSEEAATGAESFRANRRLTRRQTAHVPGPRRKPKFAATVPPVAEEEAVAEASAEAEASDEGVGSIDSQGYEKPMTLGSVDG